MLAELQFHLEIGVERELVQTLKLAGAELHNVLVARFQNTVNCNKS